MFSLKGPRFATNRRVLAEAGDSIERFFTSGVIGARDKLGPINWQFMPTKKFDAADFEAFLKLLPKASGTRAAPCRRGAPREFRAPDFIALIRQFHTPVVFAEHAAILRSPMSPAISSTRGCRR